MEPKKVLAHLLLTTAVIYLLAWKDTIPGLSVSGFYSALVVAGLMGLLSIATRTIMVTSRVPMKLLTLWFFTVVLNTVILVFISQFMDHDQFFVDGWSAAFLAALIISGAQAIMYKIIDQFSKY